MTKTRIAVVAVALSFAAAAACFAANPHMGTWKLNEAKSKLAPDMGKNMTVVYAEQGDKMKVTVDGVNKDGKSRHGVWVGKADGNTYKMKGNLPWDAAAYKVVNDRTYEITTMKEGKMLTNGKSTISADGKTRTVTTNGTGEDGKKFKSKAVYDKE
jgi:lipopolysaccharide export LptBFGC system permease protein LptF